MKNEIIFGKWTYRKNNRTLYLNDPSVYEYEVDLEEMYESSRVMDVYHQILNKKWCTPFIIYDLLKAIDKLMHPQALMCSLGQNKKIDMSNFRWL